MNLSELIKGIDVLEVSGTSDSQVAHLVYDSRKVRPHTLFVAIPGEHTDGHRFVSEAVAKGAVAVVYQNPLPSVPEATYIRVRDSQKALAQLASVFYHHPSSKMTLVGVTGTNGKTTTSLMIHAFLEEMFGTAGLMGTLQYQIGKEIRPASHTTPQSLELQELFNEMTLSGIKHCVMEVSSHSLVQHRVEGVDFQVAVFTNLTQDHLDYHKTLDQYLEAKLILFRNLLPSARAVINVDDPSSQRFIKECSGQVISYGLSHPAMIRAEQIQYLPSKTLYTIVTPSGRHAYESPLVGKFNVYNSLAAAATAYALGLPMERALKAMTTRSKVPGRMERVTEENDRFAVIVDYAHTPDGLEKVLKTARTFTQGRLITLFGCGGDRDRTKRPKMGKIAIEESDLVMITSDNPRSEDPAAILREVEEGVKQGLKEFGADKKKYHVEADRRKAIEQVLSEARSGDVVVLAGKGHETYQIFKDRTIHFDDREVAKEILLRIKS